MKTSWKCWGFVKIEFLDKNLTFRIVCRETHIKLTYFESSWGVETIGRDYAYPKHKITQFSPHDESQMMEQ